MPLFSLSLADTFFQPFLNGLNSFNTRFNPFGNANPGFAQQTQARPPQQPQFGRGNFQVRIDEVF